MTANYKQMSSSTFLHSCSDDSAKWTDQNCVVTSQTHTRSQSNSWQCDITNAPTSKEVEAQENWNLMLCWVKPAKEEKKRPERVPLPNVSQLKAQLLSLCLWLLSLLEAAGPERWIQEWHSPHRVTVHYSHVPTTSFLQKQNSPLLPSNYIRVF